MTDEERKTLVIDIMKPTKAERSAVKRDVLRELGEVRSGWFDNGGPSREHETRRRLYAQHLLTVAMRAVKAVAR